VILFIRWITVSHFDHFNDAYVGGIPFNHTGDGLKPFIEDRHYWSEIQIDGDIPPLVFDIKNDYPGFGQNILVTAEVVDFSPVSVVEVCYFVNSPPYSCSTMYDDGLHNDGQAGDGIYGGYIPAVEAAAIIEYYIKAVDDSSWESQFPLCGNKTIIFGAAPLPIYINEAMAKNESTITDDAGEFEDWVELYYAGSEPLFLGDKYLSDNPDNPTKWKFNNTMIYPNQFRVVWLDNDVDEGLYHANFKLSSAGEFIGIFHNEAHGHSLINGFEFGIQTADISYGRIPDGTGLLVLMDPTPGASNTPAATVEPVNDIKTIIQPNPFKDQFLVSFEDQINRRIRWKLTDALGKETIRSASWLSTNSFPIRTDNQESGIYFLTVETEIGEVIIKKVVLME
jgi:hypothetical protein